MEAKLVIVAPENTPGEYKLKLPTTIGRGRDASLKLLHPLVSRLHCEVFEGDDGYLKVRDLGSLNGTFVAGEKITEARLRTGELLTVGTVTFQAVYDAPAGETIEEDATQRASSEATVEADADDEGFDEAAFDQDADKAALAALDFSDSPIDSEAAEVEAEADAEISEEEETGAAPAAASGDSGIGFDLDQAVAKPGGDAMPGFSFLGQTEAPEEAEPAESEPAEEPVAAAVEPSEDDMSFDIPAAAEKEDMEFSLNLDTSEDTGVVDQDELRMEPAAAAEAGADLPPAADAEPAEAAADEEEPWSFVPKSPEGEDPAKKQGDDWNDFFKDLK